MHAAARIQWHCIMHIATDSVVAATSDAADRRWSRRNKKKLSDKRQNVNRWSVNPKTSKTREHVMLVQSSCSYISRIFRSWPPWRTTTSLLKRCWRERNREEFTNRYTQTMFIISVNNKLRVYNVLMFVVWKAVYAFHTTLYFQFLGTFATLRIGSISLASSVCPHGTNRLPMNGYAWHLALEDCSKIRRKNSDLIKLLQ